MSNPGVLALSLSLVSDSASYISYFNTVLPYLFLLGLITFMIFFYIFYIEIGDYSTLNRIRYRRKCFR